MSCHPNVSSGGYDPRLKDNVDTLKSLLERASSQGLSYAVVTPSTSTVPLPTFPSHAALVGQDVADVLFLLNFSGAQRSALLTAPSTLVLLYTPENEHFGIVPVEGMACGLPVLACDSGGPTESVVDTPHNEKTGWLRTPDPAIWANTLLEVVRLPADERRRLAENARRRAKARCGMEAMARDMENALLETVALGPVSTPVLLWAVVAAVLAVLAFWVQMFL